MSQQVVGIVVDRLLTDEALRVQFARHPVETLAELHLRGFELTPEEFAVFLQTDARVWWWDSELDGARAH